LADNARYYWHVRAFNNAGEYSAWSVVWYFRTALLPPTLGSPSDGSPAGTLKPALDWTDVTGTSSYTVQISKNVSFSLVVVNATITPSTYTPGINLPAGTTLYWRVRANGLNGTSAWSTVYSFTTP
jgi:hypothetical protein